MIRSAAATAAAAVGKLALTLVLLGGGVTLMAGQSQSPTAPPALPMPKMIKVKILEVKAPGDFMIQNLATQAQSEFKSCNDKTDFTAGHSYSIAYNDTRQGCEQIVGLKQLD